MSKIHHHPLALFNEGNDKLHCDTCRQACLTPLFRCVWCDFNLHVHCISMLPPTIKSRHVHPLTLTDSPIKDHSGEDEDAKFYCNACEERRELAHRSYYCEECPYVAHPHYVVSEIIHILEEEWSKQGSHDIANEVEIIHVLEEARSKQDNHASADNVEEPSALTLKEFLASFIEDEKKEVQGLFKAYRRDNQGDSDVNPKVSLQLDEDSTLIMKTLVSENQVAMPWENWDSTSNVIKVDSYMIIENWVPILEALFAKYGDFSGRSRLSPKAKTLYVMIICDAIHSMCSTKVVKITANLLLYWFHSFMLCQYAGFEIQFAFDHLRRVLRAHFGLQANVSADPTNIAKQDDNIPKQTALLDSTNLAIIKLDREIEDLEKTLKEKRTLRRLRMESVSDAMELEGQMAGTGLL